MKFVTLCIGHDFNLLVQVRTLVKSLLVSQEAPEIIILCDAPVDLGFPQPDCVTFLPVKDTGPFTTADAYRLKTEVYQYVKPPYLFLDSDCIVSGAIPQTDMDISVNAVRYNKLEIYGHEVGEIKESFGITSLLYFNSGTLLANTPRCKELYKLASELMKNADKDKWWAMDEPYFVIALSKLHEEGKIKIKYMDYMSAAWDLYEPLGSPDRKLIHHYHTSKHSPLASNLIYRIQEVCNEFGNKFPELIYQEFKEKLPEAA